MEVLNIKLIQVFHDIIDKKNSKLATLASSKRDNPELWFHKRAKRVKVYINFGKVYIIFLFKLQYEKSDFNILTYIPSWVFS